MVKINSYEALVKAKDKLPEEFQFLLDPAFQKEIEAIKGNPNKILAAAQVVGDQVGAENVDKGKVEELVSFLKEKGLLEGQKADSPKEEEDGEEAPPSEDDETEEAPEEEEGEEEKAPEEGEEEEDDEETSEKGSEVDSGPVAEAGSATSGEASGKDEHDSGKATELTDKEKRALGRALKVIEQLLHSD